MASLDLFQGTLDLLVLKALSWEPAHGYAVATWIRERSDDAFLVEEGALYPALHRLEIRGWLRSEWRMTENNRRAKFYRLSTLGRSELERESSYWTRVSSAVTRVMETT
jgi:PadR family transcriptional regulator PadR